MHTKSRQYYILGAPGNVLSLSGNSLTGADRGPPTAGRMDVVTVIVDGNPVLYTIQAGRALTIKTITGEVY